MILKQPETKEPFANVASPCANAGGQKRDWQLELLDNHSAFGRSRVALGMFGTTANCRKRRSIDLRFLRYEGLTAVA